MTYIGKGSEVIPGTHHKGGLYYIDIPVDGAWNPLPVSYWLCVHLHAVQIKTSFTYALTEDQVTGSRKPRTQDPSVSSSWVDHVSRHTQCTLGAWYLVCQELVSCYFCLLYMSCSECSVFAHKIIWGKSLNCNGPQGIQLTAINQNVHFV